MSKYRRLLVAVLLSSVVFGMVAFGVQYQNNSKRNGMGMMNIKLNTKGNSLSVFEIITLKYL